MNYMENTRDLKLDSLNLKACGRLDNRSSMREKNLLESGMQKSDLTFGELADVLAIYCSLAKVDQQIAINTLVDIMHQQLVDNSKFDEMQKMFQRIMNGEEMDISNPLYTYRVDLETIITNNQAVLIFDQGGLVLRRKQGSNNPNLYEFFLSNKMGSDNLRLNDIKKEILDVKLPITC